MADSLQEKFDAAELYIIALETGTRHQSKLIKDLEIENTRLVKELNLAKAPPPVTPSWPKKFLNS